MTAEYYVLRVYRRPDNGAENVLGTLEEATSGASWSFKNDAELRCAIDKVTQPDSKQTNDD